MQIRRMASTACRVGSISLLLDGSEKPAYHLGMKTSDVIAHYGSQAAAGEAIGVAQSAVAQWGESPPELRQLQYEVLTGGALNAGPECDKYRVPLVA